MLHHDAKNLDRLSVWLAKLTGEWIKDFDKEALVLYPDISNYLSHKFKLFDFIVIFMHLVSVVDLHNILLWRIADVTSTVTSTYFKQIGRHHPEHFVWSLLATKYGSLSNVLLDHIQVESSLVLRLRDCLLLVLRPIHRMDITGHNFIPCCQAAAIRYHLLLLLVEPNPPSICRTHAYGCIIDHRWSSQSLGSVIRERLPTLLALNRRFNVLNVDTAHSMTVWLVSILLMLMVLLLIMIDRIWCRFIALGANVKRARHIHWQSHGAWRGSLLLLLSRVIIIFGDLCASSIMD